MPTQEGSAVRHLLSKWKIISSISARGVDFIGGGQVDHVHHLKLRYSNLVCADRLSSEGQLAVVLVVATQSILSRFRITIVYSLLPHFGP